MGIHIWCLMAQMFLVSVNAGRHDSVPHSFYEPPQSSSPAPTQWPRPELIGMKEIVLFLTPDQVETLQAAGAVVQPYPEYETNFGELQEQFRKSIEQQNEQQYQSVEEKKQNPELLNYHKFLNIQEINDDLAQHTQATEGTTEKITIITPRYKYTRTKLRQQYKDEEYSTPFTPKKESRIKISNENNNSGLVRFLPNFENENLQIIPYQPLPLSPYQFNQDQADVYVQANKEAQQTTYTVANTDAHQNAHTRVNIVPQQTAHVQVNKDAQQSAHTIASTEAQHNVYSKENIVGQQNTYTQVNKEVQPAVYTVANREAHQNAHIQVNKEFQQNAHTIAGTEAQHNLYSQENIVGQLNAYTQVNKNALPTTNTVANTEAQQNAYSQENKVAQQTAHTVASIGVQHNVYSQENIVDQQNAYTQVNKEAQPTVYTAANTEAQQNAYSQENKVAQQHAYTVASTEAPQNVYNQVNVKAKSNAYIEANIGDRRNAFSQVNKESQRNIFRPYVPTRAQVEKESKSPQAVLEVPVSMVTQRPMKVQTYLITQDTTEFKETLSSIEGLLPLPPLSTIHEEQQEKPETPASPAPTAKTPSVHQDKFSLLLAPLYQHQAIESINRQKAKLLKSEFEIRTKLQQMKESQYYDNEEYTTQIEKLTRNFGQQNALAKMEATSISNSPSVFANQQSETTGKHPIELVKSIEIPVLVRIPKPLDVKIPAPYPAPLQYMPSFLVPKPVEVRKRGPFKEMRKMYVKVNEPYTIQKVPFTEKHRAPARIPINGPEQQKIIRHIWEH